MILINIIEGIAFLHGNEVVHRDIKPRNILLDHKFNPYLTDLGIARVLENKINTKNATSGYTGNKIYIYLTNYLYSKIC